MPKMDQREEFRAKSLVGHQWSARALTAGTWSLASRLPIAGATGLPLDSHLVGAQAVFIWQNPNLHKQLIL